MIDDYGTWLETAASALERAAELAVKEKAIDTEVTARELSAMKAKVDALISAYEWATDQEAP